jgi:mannose-6-phosphate isomerase
VRDRKSRTTIFEGELTGTMSGSPLYPLRFQPILRRLIWGGRRLGTVLHKPIGPESDYAESWELSDYHDQVSVIADGKLAGSTLRDLVLSRGQELLGQAIGVRTQFPLLVKFIDAYQPLSVQVHPDDETGRRLADDNGKTETWVIVHADPGSLVFAGLKVGVSREEFASAIHKGGVPHLLHSFEPEPGDCILIEAGTVHAIGAGVVLAEIQEMSDATFRIDDWGRLGPDGKPRPLHIRESLDSINFTRGPVNPIQSHIQSIGGAGEAECLSHSDYFALKRLRLTGPTMIGEEDRFTILMGLKGGSDVAHGEYRTRLDFGQTLLLPAAIGRCEISPDGESTILTCVVP